MFYSYASLSLSASYCQSYSTGLQVIILEPHRQLLYSVHSSVIYLTDWCREGTKKSSAPNSFIVTKYNSDQISISTWNSLMLYALTHLAVLDSNERTLFWIRSEAKYSKLESECSKEFNIQVRSPGEYLELEHTRRIAWKFWEKLMKKWRERKSEIANSHKNVLNFALAVV